MIVVALVSDLMDRLRIAGSIPETTFASTPAACADADVVVIDLGRFAAAVRDVRRRVPGAHLVAFGPHVDEAAFEQARADGADAVLPRSRFFRDPRLAIAPEASE